LKLLALFGGSRSLQMNKTDFRGVAMYIHIYIYTYIDTSICIYIYIYMYALPLAGASLISGRIYSPPLPDRPYRPISELRFTLKSEDDGLNSDVRLVDLVVS
jgi:hypothetical protein